jgi:hypothetical protein
MWPCCTALVILLLCKQVCCIWHLVYLNSLSKLAGRCCPAPTRENQMSSFTPNATNALPLSPSIFGRFLALVDRVLMANARIAIRNGDLPRIGL